MRLHFLARHLDLIGKVVKRATVAAIGMDFDKITNNAFVNQAFGGDMAFDPAQGPVDSKHFAGGLHGGDHGASIGD